MENNKLTELIIEKGLMIIAILSVIIILLIIGFIVVEGMPAKEVIARLEGIQCGRRPTSCPDQLATALKEALS